MAPLLILLLSIVALNSHTNAEMRPPLILVPGFTGCSIEYKLSNKQTKIPTCPTNTPDYDVLWLEQHNLDTINKVLCFSEDMKCEVSGNNIANFPGVLTRPRDFGGVEGLSYQDKERTQPTFYKRMVDQLIASGWRVGESLFGAPYDWRYPGVRTDSYFADLKTLIEETYEETQSKVSIMAHSMGPTVALYFLRNQRQSWRDQYIASFQAVVPVWSGDVLSVYNVVSGLDCKEVFGKGCPGGDQLGRSFLRSVGLTIPSMYWTFPTPGMGSDEGTWDRNEIIVATPNKNYTAYDMAQLFTDLGLPDAKKMQDIVAKSQQTFAAPMIDTYVYYGTGVSTTSRFNYPKDFTANMDLPLPTSSSHNASDNGDGVVPLRSALRSLQWKDAHAGAGHVLEHKAYPSMKHLDASKPVPDIVKLLLSRQKEWKVGKLENS